MPGATRALTVLQTERDGVVAETRVVPIQDGMLTMDVAPRNSLEHSLLIYPDMASLDLPDFWEGFDRHRDSLLAALKRSPPGPGLRGIVNPLGNVLRLATRTATTVPTSNAFRDEFAAYLEERYRNIETNQKAWSMSSSPIKTFAHMARLVPLWNGSRGVSQLWDPETLSLYPCSSRASTIWSDLRMVIGSVAARRYNRLASAVRAACDVPIVQEWAGWAAPYETARPSVDGLGMRSDSMSPSAIAETASTAASSLLRWRAPGWLLATDIGLTGAVDLATQLVPVLDDLGSLGARGWFVRKGPAGVPEAVAQEAARRSGDASFASWSPTPIFFPENATNPAMAQRLPGGRWWLPSPANGNRIDLGHEFFGYRYEDGERTFTALWTLRGTSRVQLRMLDPKAAQFSCADGTNPTPKFNKRGVEVTLGDSPLLVSGTTEIPIPELALTEAIAEFDALLGLAEVQGRDTTEERFLFRDALNGLDRGPAGSFATQRLQISRLNLKVASFVWIEAESSKVNTFSEVLAVPGAAGGSVLALRTELDPGATGYYAEFNVPVRSEADQEVWIAAQLPSGARASVQAIVGGQTLTLSGDSVGRYGAGFGWYRLGTTRMGGGTQKIRIVVNGSQGADILLDAVYITPGGPPPSGALPPSSAIRR